MQKKWKFSEIWRIFTEKSASDAENRDLWKITKNVTTHHQIVRFGSFLDMLVLVTSRIDFSFKILRFSFFSEKSPIFSQNRPKSRIFQTNLPWNFLPISKVGYLGGIYFFPKKFSKSRVFRHLRAKTCWHQHFFPLHITQKPLNLWPWNFDTS